MFTKRAHKIIRVAYCVIVILSCLASYAYPEMQPSTTTTLITAVLLLLSSVE